MVSPKPVGRGICRLSINGDGNGNGNGNDNGNGNGNGNGCALPVGRGRCTLALVLLLRGSTLRSGWKIVGIVGIVEIVGDNAGQPGSWVVTHSLTMLASLAASAILRGEHIYQPPSMGHQLPVFNVH